MRSNVQKASGDQRNSHSKEENMLLQKLMPQPWSPQTLLQHSFGYQLFILDNEWEGAMPEETVVIDNVAPQFANLDILFINCLQSQ